MNKQEEYVDIVDTNDNVLHSVSKTQAHKEGLLHRTVIAEYINSNREWILVKQAADRQDPGQYVSPTGGHVQSGESEDEALKREAKEEMGINIKDFKLVGKSIYRRTVGEKDENHYFIVYEIYGDDEVALNHESVAWERFTEEQLRVDLKENPDKFGAAFHFVVERFYSHLLED